MNGFTEDKDREAALKRNIEALLSRKRNEAANAYVHAAPPNTDANLNPVIEVQRENQRLQRLLGELILKNQQLRAELAGRERNFERNRETR
jgi:hypothetical protein